MNFLFVHQSFPGQYLHLLRNLAQLATHKVFFITESSQHVIPGVRLIPYARPSDSREVHVGARDLDLGLRRADAVSKAARQLRALGFCPDIIIGHHGWGELLHLPDVFPNTPIVGYLEFFFHSHGADAGFDPEFPLSPSDHGRIRAKNAINHLALALDHTGQCPTEWQRSTYPQWAQPKLTLLREGVDLTQCGPDPSQRQRSLTIGGITVRPSDRLVTYVARNLEPYRGFHSLMRSLPQVLKRTDTKCVLVGGDGISYGAPPPQGGTWRSVMLAELAGQIDPDRVAFVGQIDYASYCRLLQRTDAHVYLTYPFVASWSLREALAIGGPVIGSDTAPVREFITHDANGLLVPFGMPAAIGEAILHLLDDRALATRLRRAARDYARSHLNLVDTLHGYRRLIGGLTQSDCLLAPVSRVAG